MSDETQEHIDVERCPKCKLYGGSLDAPNAEPRCACWTIASHMFVTPTGEESAE